MMVVASSQTTPVAVLEKPRIISEIKKTKKKPPIGTNNNGLLNGKPRISGELDTNIGLQGWKSRFVEVRDGNLLVFSSNHSNQPELKLPLRRLNLQAGVKPRTFNLSRDNGAPLIIFQAGSDGEYERWVKTLAVELMRQTPLEAVRFLDILGITATLSPDTTPSRRRSEQIVGAVKRGVSEDSALRRSDVGGRLRVGAAKVVARKIMSESDTDHDDPDQELATLLVRCQQGEKFVSVREKRLLFEALCRQGRRLAHSTDNLCVGDGTSDSRRGYPLRARSLHDLSSCGNVTVREICRYFEQYGKGGGDCKPSPEPRGTPPHVNNAYLSQRRVQRGERRLSRLKQLAADSEEAIWRLQDEMAVIDSERDTKKGSSQRSRGLYAALERRLAEEETRLTRLQDEAAKVLKEIEVAASKFESALMKSNEHIDRSHF